MSNRLVQIFQHHFNNPSYLYLMLSIVVLILLPGFSENLTIGRLLMDIAFGLVVLMVVIFTTSNFKEFAVGLFLGILIYSSFLINFDAISLGLISAALNIAFFGFAFIKVANFVLLEDEVDPNVIYACICGYFILGILAAPLFALIEGLMGPAFNQSPIASFYDYIYLSFITLTTVGFGDITPVHPVAKSCTVLLSLAGQLYLTFVVAIIVGKYLVHHQNIKNI